METLLKVRYRLCVGIFQSRTVKLSSVALQLTDLKNHYLSCILCPCTLWACAVVRVFVFCVRVRVLAEEESSV